MPQIVMCVSYARPDNEEISYVESEVWRFDLPDDKLSVLENMITVLGSHCFYFDKLSRELGTMGTGHREPYRCHFEELESVRCSICEEEQNP